MSRANGYYWIRTKYDKVWIIGLWSNHLTSWSLNGSNCWLDDDFEEIDERQIVRNPVFHAPTEIKIKQAFEAGTNYVTYNGRPGYPDAPNFEEWHKTWKK